jgi:competence CoiA-like predicted nuclease
MFPKIFQNNQKNIKKKTFGFVSIREQSKWILGRVNLVCHQKSSRAQTTVVFLQYYPRRP